ncbi:MAG: endo-1,4-beta-xylanase [Bacteroidota bacterium]|jgi:endo-1,4-beta-xylanase
MYNILKLFTGRWIVLSIALLIGIPGVSNAQLVTNGSFEESNTGVVSGYDVKGWFIQVQNNPSPAPVFEIVSDTVEQGNRALKVTVHGLGPDFWDIQAVADSIPVTNGKTYNYSIWAKCTKPGGQASLTMGNYAFTEYKYIRPANLTTQWQKYTMQFTVNDNQTFIRGPVHFNFAADTGNSIYIDNLQIADVNAGKTPVIVEAESGNRGSNFPVLQDGNVTYVSVSTDNANLTYPGDTNRIITYQVTFTDSGSYNLFARVRVGSGGYSDDSFFYGHGFGLKNDTSSNDWYMVNGLAGAGFSDPAAWVDGPGSLGNGVWKWINITKNIYYSKGDSFFVSMDSLTKTFQIAGRENGLDIDKFAFGKTYLYFTVRNLDSVQAGSTTMQTITIDSSLIWKGPAFATGMSKFIGCAYGSADSKFINYWNQITPENAGKFVTVATSADSSQWNWTDLDAAYNLAKTNHLIFKDHNLIWGQQQPTWITAAGFDSAHQVNAIEQWIRMVGNRYRAMDMIDVVNEPLHNPAPYRAALGGLGSTGWDWVVWAFQKARLYMPNTKLLLNDYGIINDNSATTSYLQIINVLQSKGLIDGIGVQGHRFELESADTNIVKNNLDRLAATGLPIYISEFDLGNLLNSGTPDDNQQLQLYQKVFPILWRHPGVKGITMWDYLEGQIWQTTCYLVRADGTARPALFWLAQYVKNNPTGVEETVSRIPSHYELEQNFPNPFNPATSIRYDISKTSQVTLKVFDILGRQVQTLVNTMQAPGQYTVTFTGQNLASGIYFYRFEAGTFTETKKLMLLK